MCVCVHEKFVRHFPLAVSTAGQRTLISDSGAGRKHKICFKDDIIHAGTYRVRGSGENSVIGNDDGVFQKGEGWVFDPPNRYLMSSTESIAICTASFDLRVRRDRSNNPFLRLTAEECSVFRKRGRAIPPGADFNRNPDAQIFIPKVRFVFRYLYFSLLSTLIAVYTIRSKTALCVTKESLLSNGGAAVCPSCTPITVWLFSHFPPVFRSAKRSFSIGFSHRFH